MPETQSIQYFVSLAIVPLFFATFAGVIWFTKRLISKNDESLINLSASINSYQKQNSDDIKAIACGVSKMEVRLEGVSVKVEAATHGIERLTDQFEEINSEIKDFYKQSALTEARLKMVEVKSNGIR